MLVVRQAGTVARVVRRSKSRYCIQKTQEVKGQEREEEEEEGEEREEEEEEEGIKFKLFEFAGLVGFCDVHN